MGTFRVWTTKNVEKLRTHIYFIYYANRSLQKAETKNQNIKYN